MYQRRLPLIDKTKMSLDRLREFEPPEGKGGSQCFLFIGSYFNTDGDFEILLGRPE